MEKTCKTCKTDCSYNTLFAGIAEKKNCPNYTEKPKHNKQIGGCINTLTDYIDNFTRKTGYRYNPVVGDLYGAAIDNGYTYQEYIASVYYMLYINADFAIDDTDQYNIKIYRK